MREPHWSYCPSFPQWVHDMCAIWSSHLFDRLMQFEEVSLHTEEEGKMCRFDLKEQIVPVGLSLSLPSPPLPPSPSPPLSFSLHLSCIILSDPHPTPILHIRKVKIHTWEMSMLRLSAPSMKTWIPGYQWLMGHSQRVSSQADVYSTYNWFHFLWQH